MVRIRNLWRMIRVVKSGEFMGDAAAYKMAIMKKQEGETQYREQVLLMEGTIFSEINTASLAQYPLGTFGRAYYDFMTRNSLSPLNFSSRVKPLFTRYPVSMRYVRVHDMVHTLLGFEPDMEGEVGVYAFIGEQHYSKFLDGAAKFAKRASRLFFWKRKPMQEAIKRGLYLSERAKILICEPLESYFDKDLKSLRKELVPNYEVS